MLRGQFLFTRLWFVLIGWQWAAAAHGQDLRDQFGAKSTAAATFLNKAIQLVQQQKPADALPLFDKCLAEDPDLQLAYYWKALAYTDLGDIDAALPQYDKVLAVATRTSVTSVTIDACINAGLTLVKIKENRPSDVWLTKAVALDPDDKYDLRWKAFRNMAISHHERDEHLSAAICAMSAYSANPKRVDIKMVVDFLDKVGKEESARALDFGQTPPKVEAREQASQLEEAGTVEGLDGAITQLAVDPVGRRIFAVPQKGAKLWAMEIDKPTTAKEIPVGGTVLAVALAGPRIFVSVQGTGIVEIDGQSGKTIKTWQLQSGAPSSLAVMPAQGVALFPAERLLQIMDLETGKVAPTDFFSHAVAVDPGQQYCYSFVRRDGNNNSGHVIINGRPVFIQSSRVDWQQTALTKYAVVNKRAIPAELRMNAASNGRRLYVSPEGDWVGVVGGGGWRPEQAQGQQAGYGVAILPTADFQKVQGFYASDAYPQAVAINSVTRQVAAVRADDAHVYHLSTPDEGVKLNGPGGTDAAWSSDGKYLYIAGGSGVRVWKNGLTAAEEKPDLSWVTKLANLKGAHGTAKAARVEQPIAEFKEFKILEETGDVEDAMRTALKQGRTTKPIEWLQHPPYQTDTELRDNFRELSQLKEDKDAGIRIYRLKKLKSSHEPHPGIEFLLGMSYFAAGQFDSSIAAHLEAIHLDQARTNITLESLRCLGQIHKRQDKPLAAAYCYAHVLRVDLDDPRWAREATGMFKLAKLEDAAQELLAAAGKAAGEKTLPVLTAPVELAALPKGGDESAYAADKLFQKCAQGVVMIRADNSGGSGVCIADDGLIITNQHVVGQNPAKLSVYTFQVTNGKAERSEALEAEILYQSAVDDLALVKLKKPPKSLTPLPLATAPPAAGTKVVTIGQPGLGSIVLDQTITEGIVSAASREFNGQKFVQHTAGVNPGNSGGALLDDHGQVIGIVTWKTGLENVSFAIPAPRVRTLYETLRASKDKQDK